MNFLKPIQILLLTRQAEVVEAESVTRDEVEEQQIRQQFSQSPKEKMTQEY